MEDSVFWVERNETYDALGKCFQDYSAITLSFNDKEVVLLMDAPDCSILSEGQEVGRVPASALEDVVEKVHIATSRGISCFKDTALARVLHSCDIEYQPKEESPAFHNVRLYEETISLPYVKSLMELHSKVHPPDSRRFKELAFLNNFFFRSAASVERINNISKFAQELENKHNMEGVLICAEGSTSRGYAEKNSDVEIAIFDTEKRLDDSVLERWRTFCGENGLLTCMGKMDTYYEGIDLDDPGFIGNAFMYACYGDFITLRRLILGQCSEKQFQEGMMRFQIHNTVMVSHKSRFRRLFLQHPDSRAYLPKNLGVPPDFETIENILPSLEEMREIYSVSPSDVVQPSRGGILSRAKDRVRNLFS